MLRRLILRNFRNYVEADIEFCDNLNIFIGDNAQGKTSLLEAIHFLIIGRSFRTSQIKELIYKNGEGFYLEAHFVKNGIEQTLRFSLFGKERKIFYNSTECPSLSSLFGILVGTLVAPDDQLVKGPPQERRLFMDLQLAQYDPLYLHHITRYNRAMRHRNHLLRHRELKSIEMWEHEMANSGAYVIFKRQQFAENLSPIVKEIHRNLNCGNSSLNFQYKTKNVTKEELLQQFNLHRPKDLAMKSTSIGPHRDEIVLELDGMDARSYGSEGQKRLCVTSLRLASWEHLKAKVEMTPLMLMDDLTANLDSNHQNKVVEQLEKMGQVFITTTSDLSCKKEKRYFRIQKGVVDPKDEKDIKDEKDRKD